MEPETTEPKPVDPASIPLRIGNEERYAWERALGYSTRESVRRIGMKPENGIGTKYETKPRIVARIRYLRSQGLSDEMLAEKRRRLEDRLNLVAYGDILDCAKLDERSKLPVIDWEKVKESDLSVIINEFSFDSETGELTKFKRDDALNAINQLRDMHGFKAPTKIAPTGPDGSGPARFIVENAPLEAPTP